MVKNGIFESMIKLCSANYAPSGAQNRAKLSVKIVRKAHSNFAKLARIAAVLMMIFVQLRKRLLAAEGKCHSGNV